LTLSERKGFSQRRKARKETKVFFYKKVFLCALIPIRFQKTVFSVKPLFKRFQQFKRFEKSLYGLKRPIFESELVLACFARN
jgi:hypothetical protein